MSTPARGPGGRPRPPDWVPDPISRPLPGAVEGKVPLTVQLPAYPTQLEELIAILGVPFHALTLEGAVDRVAAMVGDGGAHYVVTPNVDFLVKAQRDPELRQILVRADLVLCDGKPIVWASHWLGGALPARVAGSDLIPGLLSRAAELGWRVFLLGGSPDVTAEAARRIAAAYPALPPVAHYSPPYRPLCARWTMPRSPPACAPPGRTSCSSASAARSRRSGCRSTAGSSGCRS